MIMISIYFFFQLQILCLFLIKGIHLILHLNNTQNPHVKEDIPFEARKSNINYNDNYILTIEYTIKFKTYDEVI